MRFSLRKATADDAPALADIHVRARRECMSYLPEIHSPEDVLEWIRGIIPQHDEVWLAEDDGRVVGFFMLSDGLLYHLYVYPELHGQGAGSLLFERVKELSPRGFRLWLFQRHPAGARLLRASREAGRRADGRLAERGARAGRALRVAS